MKALMITILVFFATTFSQATPPSEMDKIQFLISAVEKSGLNFVRNGTSYNSSDAANHLRQKLTSATSGFFGRSQKVTVENFITRLASKSSLTGRDYLIQVSLNSFVTAESWLREKLAEYERVNANTPSN
jgi:hypothetical protein